jgi:transcriptional regulator with XRE-family HTH domain
MTVKKVTDKDFNTVAALVGAAIKRARGPLNQSDFAKNCGVKQAMISRYEAGASLPATDTLIRIAKGSRTPIGDLTREAEKEIQRIMNESPAPKPKAVKNPVDKLAKKATAKAAALDAPDVVKPKRSHSKKPTPLVIPGPAMTAADDDTVRAVSEVVNE